MIFHFNYMSFEILDINGRIFAFFERIFTLSERITTFNERIEKSFIDC